MLIMLSSWLNMLLSIHMAIKIPVNIDKIGRQRCNKESTELCILFIAADSIVDAISSIRLVL